VSHSESGFHVRLRFWFVSIRPAPKIDAAPIWDYEARLTGERAGRRQIAPFVFTFSAAACVIIGQAR
jgi:hypothetical protein